jgi:photosystem II stability/assembly factor-like uncharacterized protein
MNNNVTVMVGSVGQGVHRSTDGGQTWSRISVGQGLHSDAIVRTLAVHPTNALEILCGTDLGLYKSVDSGASWSRVDSALNEFCVWSLAIDPTNPKVIFAGTGTPTPARIFRSNNGGLTWSQRPMDVADECAAVGVPRITGIAIDPDNSKSIWAGIEVDGLRHSADGGDSWSRVGESIPNMDFHNVSVVSGPPKRVFAIVNNDAYFSEDEGESWESVRARENFPWTYSRGVCTSPANGKTLFVTIGDTTPGSDGAVMRSDDTGKTWERVSLPDQPNSAMWVVNLQAWDPEVVFAASRYGYLYRSDDAGHSWSRIGREFSEVSSIIWVPTQSPN